MNTEDTVNWARSIRWLHFGLALTVITQLLTSQFMTPPFDVHTTILGKAVFSLHEYDGFAVVGIIELHWLWLAMDQRLFRHLFPWTLHGFAEVREDLKHLLRGRLPNTGDRGGLPGLVHGLGLLTATAMGLTGLSIFWLLHTSAPPKVIKALLLQLHSLIAYLMWAYLAGHVLLAVVHQIMGYPVIKRMFRP